MQGLLNVQNLLCVQDLRILGILSLHAGILASGTLFLGESGRETVTTPHRGTVRGRPIKQPSQPSKE
jgi:hypothetical protein